MKHGLATLSALALAAALAAPAPLLAQGAADGIHAGSLEVPVNKSQVVSSDRTIAKALVGNSDIADVLPISQRSVYVLGKAKGTTSLTLYDPANRVLAVMDVAVGPDVEGLRRQMAQLIPGQTIDARISNESIILSGMVSDPGAADRAAQLAKAYAGDKVINLITLGASQQVMLEVRFAEVRRRWGDEIGVNYAAQAKDGRFGAVLGDGSTFSPGGSVTTSNSTNTTQGSNSNNSTNTNTNVTSSNSANANTSSTNIGQSGSTGSYTGSVGDFTNLGNLNGRTFTGSGSAGSDGTTSTTSNNASGTSAIGSITGAIGSTAVATATTATSTLSSIMQMGAIGGGFGIFSKKFNIGNVAIEGVLNALERKGLAKTLAEPTLVALSGEKASFLAGGEFPIPVAQTGVGAGGANAITVEFKPFGVSLAFTPTVLGDKVINLIVEPEVSSIDPSASVAINGIVVPGLQTRRASTTLELRDGESFAIAGLMQRDFQTTVRSLPGLSSIPIIGALFRSSSFQKGETELLIVVTPRLISPLRPDQVRLPTDMLEDPRAIDMLLDGLGDRRKRLPPQPKPARARPEQAPPETSMNGGGEMSPVAQAPAPAAGPAPKEQGYDY